MTRPVTLVPAVDTRTRRLPPPSPPPARNLHRIYGPVRLPLLLEGWGGAAPAVADALAAVTAAASPDVAAFPSAPLPRRYITSTPDRVFLLTNDHPLSVDDVRVRAARGLGKGGVGGRGRWTGPVFLRLTRL